MIVNRTFSGTDTLAFILFPNCAPILLGSVSTLSYSMYRKKAPVPLISKINLGGFTRGTRVIAGTLILTLLNQHWVNEVKKELNFLEDWKNIKADELPIFDIMLISANEYGASISSFIYGVDITEEGGVISIEDLFMENTQQFVARDIDNFKEVINNDVFLEYSKNKISKVQIKGERNLFVLNSSQIDEYVNVDELQKSINKKGYDLSVTGKYDDNTIKAIKELNEEFNLSHSAGINTNLVNYLNKEAVSYKNEKIELTLKECINGALSLEFEEIKSLRVSCIAFNEDNIKTYIRDIESNTVSTNVVAEAFFYNKDLKGFPKKVDFIVTGDNVSCKWNIKLKEV